jgi:UPF0755 protein
MKSRRRSPFAATCAILLVLLCLGFFLSGYLFYTLQVRLAETFGPPASHLGFAQRMRLSVGLLVQSSDLTEPVDPLGDQRDFQVAWGETLPAIAGRLQAQGLIHDAAAFRSYLQYAGLDTSLQAGNYQLSPAMSPVQIAHNLQDATPGEVTLTILEGWRLEEIAATLPTSGLEISPEDFLEAARQVPDGYSFFEGAPADSLEGFLFPGSYTLPRETTLSELIPILLESFEDALTAEMRTGFSQQDLSVFEAIALASIVERESIDREEMPMIASVFLNRLEAGIKLEADSTVQYALGYNARHDSWWKSPLSSADLSIDSPYNTYRHPGLPPGPIANPGLDALRAVAFPAQTPYYYFRAACDGSGKHVFAQTFDEHLANACEEEE